MKLFFTKLLNCVCIVALVLIFNKVVHENENAELETQQQYERFTAVQQALTEQETEVATATVTTTDLSIYVDGVYTGTAKGFGGDVVMEVVIENDIITEINVVSAENEDDAYFDAAIAVVDAILENQSTNVDVVSGATFSSNGILGAVAEALGKAAR